MTEEEVFEEYKKGRNGYLIKFKNGSETWIASDVFFDQGNKEEGFEVVFANYAKGVKLVREKDALNSIPFMYPPVAVFERDDVKSVARWVRDGEDKNTQTRPLGR
jgi:hypothetical protein